MWVIAVCHDVAFEQTQRSALFQAHVAHNLARLASFLLAAPVATADGVDGRENDPRLSGSFYCLAVENLDAARAMVESDPFMGGAWRQIDYYEWRAPAGAWLGPGASYRRPGADFRCYVAASRTSLMVGDALIGGRVTLLASTGDVREPLAAIAVLQADSIEDAKALAAGAHWVVSAPIAVGRWMGVSSVEDLQR